MMTSRHSFAQAPWLAWMCGRAEWVAAMLAIVCFANVLPNDFAGDGGPIVQNSDKVNKPGQWWTIWSTDYWYKADSEWANRDLLYRPMAVSSYRLVRMIGGASAWPQHLCNVLLHALASAMVVRLCRKVGVAALGGLVAGAVFAVLPIHSEVLGNVVGRADLLATCGMLAALLAQRRVVHAVSTRRVLLWGLVVAVAAFVAMSSKESAVALVVIVALFDFLWARTRTESVGGIGDKTPRIEASILLRLVWVLVPTAIYLALRYTVFGGRLHQAPALTKTVNVLVDAPTWQHWLGVVQLWGMYWAKTFWPDTLSVIYSLNGVRLATSVSDVHVIIGFCAIVVLGVASVVSIKRREWSIAILTLALLVAYFPTSNAFVLLQVFFAERIWYLPSVFVCILLGIGFAKLASRPAGVWIGALLVVAMVGRCWVRNADWKNNGTLYASAYRDRPNDVVAIHCLALWKSSVGEDDEAIALWKRAVEIDLGYTSAHRFLGRAYAARGLFAEAVHHLQVANLQIPGDAETESELKAAVAQMSEVSSGRLAELRRKVEGEPDDLAAQLALIRAFRDAGQVQEAIQYQEANSERFLNVAEWQQEFAVTLIFLGRRDEALERYAKALELAPNDVQLMVEYAMLLLERRQGDDVVKAQSLADRAAGVAPDAMFVLVCRAELLALRGELREAAELYRKAMSGLPEGHPQRAIFEQRLMSLGG